MLLRYRVGELSTPSHSSDEALLPLQAGLSMVATILAFGHGPRTLCIRPHRHSPASNLLRSVGLPDKPRVCLRKQLDKQGNIWANQKSSAQIRRGKETAAKSRTLQQDPTRHIPYNSTDLRNLQEHSKRANENNPPNQIKTTHANMQKRIKSRT